MLPIVPQSVPVSCRQFPSSMSLLPFLDTDVMPGIAFPLPCGFYRGSLGPRFPTPPGGDCSLPRGTVRCYDCLRPSRSVRFPSLPLPWVDALFFCVPPSSRWGRLIRWPRLSLCPSQLALRSIHPLAASANERLGVGLCRSPAIRLLFPRRREALPSSRITPVNTCPALRPRWCPTRLPWRGEDCCLPVGADRRLCVRLHGLIR